MGFQEWELSKMGAWKSKISISVALEITEVMQQALQKVDKTLMGGCSAAGWFQPIKGYAGENKISGVQLIKSHI